jgi:hypothetical protein
MDKQVNAKVVQKSAVLMVTENLRILKILTYGQSTLAIKRTLFSICLLE